MIAPWRCFRQDWIPVFATEHKTNIVKLDLPFAFVHYSNLDRGRRKSQLAGDFGVAGTWFYHCFNTDSLLVWPSAP